MSLDQLEQKISDLAGAAPTTAPTVMASSGAQAAKAAKVSVAEFGR